MNMEEPSSETITLQPHPDIELRTARPQLTCHLNLPEAGINADTGIILAIEGYGSLAASEYAANLRAYLANHYNCLAVSVGYFGQAMKHRGRLVPSPDFFLQLGEHHGVSITAPRGVDPANLFDTLADELVRSGLTELHPACRLLCEADEYQSFGILPALDHLQTLHYLIGRYPVNQKRIYILGSSYGGYIGLLLGKLAPNTFRLIIDNSGFVTANNDIYGDGLSRGRVATRFGPLTVTRHEPKVWSRDPNSPRNFGPAHAMIRSLLVEAHRLQTTTVYFCSHWVGDTVAPFAEKVQFTESMKHLTRVHLLAVMDDDIDNTIFKMPGHGLGASLRRLFDHAYVAYLTGGGHPATITDFDLGSRHVFNCGDRSYVFQYSRDKGVLVAIT